LTRSIFCFLFFVFVLACTKDDVGNGPVEEFDQVRVMTYNILFSTSNTETLKVLRETAADIVGMQETSRSRLIDLARDLGYYSHSFLQTPANRSSEDTGILSRFPITKVFANGVLIKVNPSLEVAVFTVHLSPYPYEPYDFRDGKITTADQAVASASLTRLEEIEPVVEEMKQVMNDGYTTLLTGDFNEPSSLDWTPITAENNLHFGKVVAWPVSTIISDAGLKDVYRDKFPNAANFPGNTWTTLQAPDEVYDRIDIIYQNETEALVLSDIRTVGGEGDAAGITVENYPSDHYAVIATYKIR
jgi:endonuclease/exonuclease/phosphatase family metal-dependent hydrolase